MFNRSALHGLVGCVLALALSTASFAQCGSCPVCPAPAPSCQTCQANPCPCQPAPAPSIAQILSSNCQASSFVAAATQTGLMTTLSGPGPFTVFVPTNAAFCKVDTCTKNGWADDPKLLATALQYHVAYGRLMAQDLSKLNTLGTLACQPLQMWARPDGKKIIVNNVKTTCVNVVACNGVIHYIDTVLTPPSTATCCPSSNGCSTGTCPPTIQVCPSSSCGNPNDLMTVLSADPQYSTFTKLLEQTGLACEISETGPITVFDATNCAFEALPLGMMDNLNNDPNRLRQILLNHIVPGSYTVCQLKGTCSLPTFLGCAPLTFTCVGPTVKINCNQAKVVVLDTRACNGIIQGIDNLLVPTA